LTGRDLSFYDSVHHAFAENGTASYFRIFSQEKDRYAHETCITFYMDDPRLAMPGRQLARLAVLFTPCCERRKRESKKIGLTGWTRPSAVTRLMAASRRDKINFPKEKK